MTESWQDAYREAILEVDPAKIAHRIEVAKAAIRKRLDQQAEPLTKSEFEDIDGALRTLRFLTKEAA